MLKVALVGKPNVGKSTLFNRIINKKKSIVNDQPGVTRDRIYSDAIWLNKEFTIIDTGGITNKEFSFKQNIEEQVKYAIDEADVILFVVSNKDGVNNEDHYAAKLLKKFKNKKIILVVNKSESSNRDDKIYYGLGFGKPYYISAEHKIGTGDLLDAVINTKTSIAKAKIDKNFSFCIIGRPNVGKSTLLNTIVQENRSIVSPIAHTTRDAIDADFKYNGEKFTIVDTAGIRRKGKIGDEIELFAIMRTQQAIDRSNLILFVIDGSESFNEQDEVIGGLAYKANIPTIIVVNKWDNVKNKDQSSMRKMEVDIRTRFKYLAWAPIVFISAKENERVATIFKTIELVREQLKIKVTTSALNNVLARAQISNPPPRIQGDRIDIKYGTQVKSSIPTFTLFTNDPKHLHFAYMRYIENTIRESFGINIVPITVYYKDKNARIRTEK